MKTLLRHALLPLAALTLATAAVAAPPLPATLAFDAFYIGTAQVVEVIDPGVPLLRFESNAVGGGSFDLASYFSTDVIDMSTGAGTGISRFVATNGDELHGSFSVQVVPTSVANIVDLIGQASFLGGTGLFSGASGSALLSGTGLFTSPTLANATFRYNGSISLVPEPASWLLLSAGAVALVVRARRRS